VQLGLEVVDVALGSNQLILSMLQSGAGVTEVVSFEVAAVISPHQLIIQLSDARLQAGVLLQKLSVALLDVLDDAVQPITTEPSFGSKGGVEVVIHLSKTREKRINISSIEQRQQTKTPK
jgi:hypothetical protein